MVAVRVLLSVVVRVMVRVIVRGTCTVLIEEGRREHRLPTPTTFRLGFWVRVRAEATVSVRAHQTADAHDALGIGLSAGFGAYTLVVAGEDALGLGWVSAAQASPRRRRWLGSRHN